MEMERNDGPFRLFFGDGSTQKQTNVFNSTRKEESIVILIHDNIELACR
jgi:hypothetical protein